MRILLYISLLLASLVGMLSCREPVNERLAYAESLMDEHPDSALLSLDSIHKEELNTETDKAMYDYLLTMALDKNHLAPTDDVPITRAMNLFRNNGDKSREVIATHYQGRVFYHSGDYAHAIVSYFKTKHLAEQTGSVFWQAMACRGIADIYHETFNSADELFYVHQQYALIKECGKQPYLNYTFVDLGQAYNNTLKLDSAIYYLDMALDSATKYNDPYLKYCAAQTKSLSLMKQEKDYLAVPILKEIIKSEEKERDDSLYLCLALANSGAYYDALNLYDKIPTDSTPIHNNIKYALYKGERDFENALSLLEKLDMGAVETLRTSMSQNLMSALSEYFELSEKLSESETRADRLAFWLTICGLGTLLLATGYIAYVLIKKREREKNEKVLLAEQLQESLSRSEEKASDIIKKLTASRYSIIEEICSIIIQNPDSKKTRNKIAEMVTNLIESLSLRSEKVEELERQVDDTFSNLFSDFKMDLPGLKEIDYLLFLFSVLGLSSSTISVLLKEQKVESVYNRKKRLKDKIKKLPDDKRDHYLSFLAQ